MAVVLSWAMIVVALVAAGLWVYASTIELKKGDPRAKGNYFVNKVDIIYTAREQSRWNKYAALATALSVILQAIPPLLPSDHRSESPVAVREPL